MTKHRLNVFDVTVVLLILLFAVFHLGAYTSLPEENGNVSFTLTVDEMDEYASLSFKAGCILYSENEEVLGTITDVEVLKNISNDSESNSGSSEYYGMYTVKIRVSSDAVLTKNSISVNGQIISSGRVIPFTTNGTSASGSCSQVTFSYYDGGQQK